MGFDKILLSHNDPNSDCVVDAKSKIQEYIDYRVQSEQKILKFIQAHKPTLD